MPDSSTPVDVGRSKKFAPSVIEGTLGRVRAWTQSDSGDDLDRSSVSIPVMGRIAAGTPIAALQNRSHTISLPPDMLPPGDYYALEVRGDLMIDAGIFDSDTVVIRKQDTAETGDIVVALIDDEEATLKRLRKRGASIALEAANPAYETAHIRSRPGPHSGQARQPRSQILNLWRGSRPTAKSKVCFM